MFSALVAVEGLEALFNEASEAAEPVSPKSTRVVIVGISKDVRRKSCLTNLTAFHDEMTTSLDDGKAVDTVSHNILIHKLMEYRPDERKVKWTENCPKCQAQAVVINDT